MADSVQETPGSLEASSLVVEVSKAVVSALEDRLGGLSTQMQEVAQAVSDFNRRVEQAESRISSLEDQRVSDVARLESLEAALRKHHDKLEDLENRSRRNNL